MTNSTNTDSDRLIEMYRSYAHALAVGILKTLPSSVDRDDVIGPAELGLVEAARKFDPSRGVLFKTFAYYFIRGAIYDSVRKMGWLKSDPRLRFEEAADKYLKDHIDTAQNETAPASEAYEELQRLTSGVVTSYVLSLANWEIPDRNAISAEDAIIQREAVENLQHALSQLPEKNRRLIEAYYFHDLTLEEIGRRLGLSKGWVCRLHAKSLDMLRELMAQSIPIGAGYKQP